MVDAAVRELESALVADGDLRASLVNPHDPIVAEYAPRGSGPGLHDPRKHAVGMTFVARLEEVRGVHGPEALEFAWFDPSALDAKIMGFGQELLLPRLLSLA